MRAIYCHIRDTVRLDKVTDILRLSFNDPSHLIHYAIAGATPQRMIQPVPAELLTGLLIVASKPRSERACQHMKALQSEVIPQNLCYCYTEPGPRKLGGEDGGMHLAETWDRLLRRARVNLNGKFRKMIAARNNTKKSA